MTNVQEETQNKRAKQLQDEAELTIWEDTGNWVACDKYKKWRKPSRLGAYEVTCERINRKCEETADDERMEGEEEEKAREKSRSSQEKWTEQIKKWKEKYGRVRDKRIKDLYKVYREVETEEMEKDKETNPQTKEEEHGKNEEIIETQIDGKKKT